MDYSLWFSVHKRVGGRIQQQQMHKGRIYSSSRACALSGVVHRICPLFGLNGQRTSLGNLLADGQGHLLQVASLSSFWSAEHADSTLYEGLNLISSRGIRTVDGLKQCTACPSPSQGFALQPNPHTALRSARQLAANLHSSHIDKTRST